MAKGGSTQTGYVLALYMNLVPDNLRSAAADKLVEKIKSNNWKLGTDFSARRICWQSSKTRATPMSPTACFSTRNIRRGDTLSAMAQPPCGSAGTAIRCAAIPA